MPRFRFAGHWLFFGIRKLRPPRDRSFCFLIERRPSRAIRLIAFAAGRGFAAAPPVLLAAPLAAPTVPLVLDFDFTPASFGASGCAARSRAASRRSALLLPCAPPRICVSDDTPCANTGPASNADMATAIAEVFTNFFTSPGLLAMTSPTCAVHLNRTGSSRRSSVCERRLAMQAARCGDRAGFRGLSRSLATDRPLAAVPGLTSRAGGTGHGESTPLLFCRETARYYHRLFAAT